MRLTPATWLTTPKSNGPAMPGEFGAGADKSQRTRRIGLGDHRAIERAAERLRAALHQPHREGQDVKWVADCIKKPAMEIEHVDP